MKPYIYLEHTADAKFQAFGKNLEEAFRNAALAMFNIITDTEKIEPRIEHNISISSESKESLLYDFLEAIIILVDTEGFLLNDVEELNITDNKLKCRLKGDNNSDKYDINTAIKAVTYNDMLIEKKDGKVMIQVVVDI